MKKLSRLSLGLLVGAFSSAMALASPSLAAPLSLGGGAGLAASSPVAAAAPVSFQVYLPLQNTAQLQQLLADQQNSASPNYQKWLTPAQFAAQFGPTQASLSKVQATLQSAGLQVSPTGVRSFQVSGTAAQVNKTLQTSLKTIAVSGGPQRMVASVKPVLPAALQQEGAHIISFAGLAPKHVFSQKSALQVPDNRYGSTIGPYWYDDMKEAYDYPSYQSKLPSGARLDGTGVRAAVLMSDLLFPNDVASFFTHEQFTTLTGLPAPTVNTVAIDGGGVVNGGGSFEASLDVQQILGGAPGSSVTLVSIPDLSDDHIMDGYNYIVAHPELYDVVNSSFGGCELAYTAAYNGGEDFTYILAEYDAIFMQGNAEGITFSASSGDEAGLECPSVGYFTGVGPSIFVKSVSTPATSPYVTAVGGGNLVVGATPAGSLDAPYASENAFGDPEVPHDPYDVGQNASGGYWGAGGGQSALEPRPTYQVASVTGSAMRALPDIGMQVGGCPEGESYTPCGPQRSAAVTAYGVGFGGGYYGVIGTSVSSPEFVGALALYIQKVGHKVGNINPYLYSKGAAQTAAGGPSAPTASQFYHRAIPGFDGAWPSGYPSANYNYSYGNGSPDVRKLFGFTGFAAAGTPQTLSNP